MSTPALSRAATGRRLDPIADRQAEIERASGVTITLNRIDDPWSDGSPTYWHGFVNDEIGGPVTRSTTTLSTTGDGAFEVLDKLAAALGVVEAVEIERAA